MWVRFTADFNFRPNVGTTIAYKAGMLQNVTRRCAMEATLKGKAVRMTKSRKDEEPVEWPPNEKVPAHSASE